jgi:hypothetical protein
MSYDGFYDEELPAGYQEADMLQASYEAESREFDRERAQGHCHHNARLGRRVPSFYEASDVAAMLAAGHFANRGGFTGAQSDIPEGQDLCTECGELVPSWDVE